MKKVEQVDVDGNIVLDYDISLSTKAIFEKVHGIFPEIYKDTDGMICGCYNGIKYAIRIKNVTYLGNPHPLYKKRIQIAEDLQVFYKDAKIKGRVPLLLGIYSYKDNTVFCDFNIDDFVEKKAHNSSAHIYIENIADATMYGYFEKEDYFGNHVTAFTPTAVKAFLNNKFGFVVDSQEERKSIFNVKSGYGTQRVSDAQDGFIVSNHTIGMPTEIERIIIEFFAKEPKTWNGIDCYKTMIADNYRNKYQPEWPGFYLEYEFERYIQRNNYMNLIQYAQDKTRGGIDLDLYFPTISMYGDLKAHSSQSKGIQGNDWQTVLGIIGEGRRDNHIYYIVCEHDTEKDSNYSYEVTHYWNTAQDKADIMSYHKRMKHNVCLKKAYILDINKSNENYLSKFKQGLNSNGKPREPKILIEYDKISKFVIAERNL